MRVWLAMAFAVTVVVLAGSSQESFAQGKGPRQGMMQGGNQGMMSGRMGQGMMGGRMGQGMMGQGMGRMGPQQGMMGQGMGHGAMGQGMGHGAMGQGMMGQGMGPMGPQQGMMEDAKPDVNDPAAVLANKDALGLTEDQVKRLEEMRAEGRKRAGRVMTSEQKKKFHGMSKAPTAAKGPMGPMNHGGQGPMNHGGQGPMNHGGQGPMNHGGPGK